MTIRLTAWLLAFAALFLAGTSTEAQNPKVKAVFKVVDKGGEIGDIAFTPDGKSLAVTSAGAEADVYGLYLWDLQTLKPTQIPKARVVRSLSFSPDGKLLTGIATGNTAYVVDPKTGEKQILGAGSKTSVVFSPDGKTIASAESQPNIMGGPSSITLWDVKSRTERKLMPYGKSLSTYLAFSPDGKTLAAVRDGNIDLIATGTAKVTKTLTGVVARCVAFSSDGKTLASGSNDIKLWDLATGKEQATFKGVGANRLAFSPDGKTLAVTNSGFVLWDIEAGKERFSVRLLRDAHKDVPNEAAAKMVAFSPDGKTIAIGCNEIGSGKAVVVLWDVPAN